MKCSSISSLFVLAVLLASSFAQSTGSSDATDEALLTPTGCLRFHDDDQYVKFHSDGSVFEMWIPIDGKNYNLGHPLAQLQCNVLSTTTSLKSCVSCFNRMDFVEVFKQIPCSFLVQDDSKNLFSVDVDSRSNVVTYPLQGYLALVTCRKPSNKVRKDLESAQLLCPNTQGSSVTLTMGSQKYILSVPADETTYDVVGPGSALGCIGPIGTKYSLCQACNFPVQLIRISVEAGLCAFNLSGSYDIVYLDHKSGPYSVSAPAQILDVTCGLSSPSSLDSPREQLDIRSAPVACPAWVDSTTISLVSGGSDPLVKYDLQIRPDGNRFQLDVPPYRAGCLRRDKLYTDQCFPCTMDFVFITVEEGIYCIFEIFIRDHECPGTLEIQGPQEIDSTEGLRFAGLTCHRRSKPTGWAVIKSEARDAAAFSDLHSRDNAETQPLTKNVNQQNGIIQFFGSNRLGGVLAVPPDMQYYTLSGQSPAFECDIYENNVPLRRGTCSDFAWKLVYVHEDLEECRFQIEGWSELYVWQPDFDEPQRFENPVKILGVQCGFGQRNNPPRIAARSPDQPPAGNDETAHLWARESYNRSQPQNWVLFWNSDGWTSTVQVPADTQYYNLSGSDPQLMCYYLSIPYYPLHDVHSCSDWTWQYVSVVGEALGECRLTLNGVDEPYVKRYGEATTADFLPPVQVLGIQCGFGKDNGAHVVVDNSTGQYEIVTPPPLNRKPISSRRNLVTSQSDRECKLGDGIITLTQSSGEDHIIRAPADRAMHPVSTAGNGIIGCESAVSGGCFDCGIDYLTVTISASLNTCIFSSYKTGMNIIVSSNASRIIQNGILRPYDGFSDLVCGFEYWEIPNYLFPQPAHPNDIARSLGPTSEVRESTPESRDALCQGLSYKVSIQTQDGNVYFAPVPLDYKFHSMSEMSCVRIPDAACVPCSEIGPAISVDTAIQWGPCIFFTEDHRAFFTQYWNSMPDGSQATPLTLLDPAGVISGIECGGGA